MVLDRVTEEENRFQSPVADDSDAWKPVVGIEAISLSDTVNVKDLSDRAMSSIDETHPDMLDGLQYVGFYADDNEMNDVLQMCISMYSTVLKESQDFLDILMASSAEIMMPIKRSAFYYLIFEDERLQNMICQGMLGRIKVFPVSRSDLEIFLFGTRDGITGEFGGGTDALKHIFSVGGYDEVDTQLDQCVRFVDDIKDRVKLGGIYGWASRERESKGLPPRKPQVLHNDMGYIIL